MASVVPNNEATQFRSGDKAVENGRKGGIASGEARRKKATMKKTLEYLLDEKSENGKSYRELATLGLLKGAINGNAQNYRIILETLGELKQLEESQAQKELSNVEKLLAKLEGEAGDDSK